MASAIVRKRDGRLERFQTEKLAASLLRASSLPDDKVSQLLAGELARAISQVLLPEERVSASLLEAEEIGRVALACLEKTGLEQDAERYRQRAVWRGERRDKLVVCSLSSGPSNPEGGQEEAWRKGRLQATLTVAGLGPREAELISRSVEERLFATGLDRVSRALIHELVDSELSSRGHGARLSGERPLATTAWLRDRIASGAAQRPASFARDLTGDLLRRYAQEELLPGRCRLALEQGSLALLGLGAPFSVLCSSDLELAGVWISQRWHTGEPLRLLPGLQTVLLVTPEELEAAILLPQRGQRVLVELRRPEDLPSVQQIAQEGGRFLLACPNPHRGAPPWIADPESAVGELALVNLARCALRAGRGERDAFRSGMRSAVDTACEALAARSAILEGITFRPSLPLWQGEATPKPRLRFGLVPVGLSASIAWLTGEGLPGEPRHRALALEILRELRKSVKNGAAKYKLSLKTSVVTEGDVAHELTAMRRADQRDFSDAVELAALPEAYEAPWPRACLLDKARYAKALGVELLLDEHELQSLDPAELQRLVKLR